MIKIIEMTPISFILLERKSTLLNPHRKPVHTRNKEKK